MGTMGGHRPDRDVVSVIVQMREILSVTAPRDCSTVAAEYLCDLFGGTAAAINLMDHGLSRFQTVRNVGRLTAAERVIPMGEYYAFVDFPFTTAHLARGAAYRASLADPDCPAEYRALLSGQRRGACLGAPIRHAGRPVGEFWVARDTAEPFGEEDIDFAVACGATLARFFRPAAVVASAS
jgi:GAF domain-containing protein